MQFDNNGNSTPSDIITIKQDIKPFVSDINYYPNPVQSQLSIEFVSYFEDYMNIRILNSTGAVISMENREVYNGFNRITLNFNDYPSGIYTVHLYNQQQTETIKIVK
jgi:type IX secretion system substrate protein